MDMTHATNQLYMLGTMNSMRTGNPVFDGIFIILLPTIMNYIGQLASMIVSYFTRFVKKTSNQEFYIRKIESNPHVPLQYYNYNIHTAICMYINHLNIDILDCEIETSFKNHQTEMNIARGSLSKKDQFEEMKLIQKPSTDIWINIHNSVEVMFEKKQQEKNERESWSPNGQQLRPFTYAVSIRSRMLNNIDNFLDNAIKYYKNQLSAEDDAKRYMYLPKCDAFDSKLTFNTYILSDTKTFDSLFIPNKAELINTLDNFQDHTGRYAITGIKQQLGLLLHGAPGTGKTSLIKSIANKFNRHIVNIPLSSISTNAQLLDLMFNLDYVNHDKEQNYDRQSGMPISPAKKLKFEDLVFVMEDIDAVGDIVHERDGRIEESYENIEEQDDENQEERDLKIDGMNDMLATLNQQMSMSMGTRPPKNMAVLKKKSKTLDKLNLAGLLNAIDGIVDAPGRIIVMTSNHPEKLDKALKRPGRIDKIIKLDYIAEDEAIEMCYHFFNDNEVCESEKEIREIIRNNKFTPAQIEQFSLESNNVDTLIEHLKNKSP